MFLVSWPFGSGDEGQKRIFKMAAMAGFLNVMFLAIFDLQVTLIFPTKFRVSWLFDSDEEGKKRFSRWPPC